MKSCFKTKAFVIGLLTLFLFSCEKLQKKHQNSDLKVEALYGWTKEAKTDDFGDVESYIYYYETSDLKNNEVILISIEGDEVALFRFNERNEIIPSRGHNFYIKLKTSEGTIEEYYLVSSFDGKFSSDRNWNFGKRITSESGESLRAAIYDGDKLLNSFLLKTIAPKF